MNSYTKRPDGLRFAPPILEKIDGFASIHPSYGSKGIVMVLVVPWDMRYCQTALGKA